MKSVSFLSALILSLGILGGGWFIAESLVYIKDFEKTVSVKGLDERQVQADTALWKISYTVAGNDLKTVYAQLSQSQKNIHSFLINRGFSSEELENKAPDITDNKANSYSSAAAYRYSVRSALNVSTTKVDQVRKALQEINQLVSQGVTITNNQVDYLFTGLNAIKEEMLKKATQNARQAAQVFAKNAGQLVGGLRDVTQGYFEIKDANSVEYGNTKSLQKTVRVVVRAKYFLQ